MRTIIDDEVYLRAKKGLSKLGKEGVIARKLQAIISAHNHGIITACKILGISKGSLYLWAKEVKDGTIEGLKNKPKLHDGLKLKKLHKEAIKDYLSNNPNLTALEIKSILIKKFNLDVSIPTVYRAMHSSGYSYITGRKQHYKQDQSSIDTFKK